MTTQTFEATCPTCQTLLTLPSLGHFSCPKCGQAIEVGNDSFPIPEYPPKRTGKVKVNNGLGWWTAVAVVGWLFVLSACALFLFASAGIFAASKAAQQEVQTGGVMIALTFGAPGAIAAAIGIGLLCWARSGKRTLICGECRNQTTKHARVCASCRAEFR